MCGPRERYGEFSFGGGGTLPAGVRSALAWPAWVLRPRRRTLRRGRDICGWRGSRPFAPFALFAAFQDDAAVFGHTRPAGLDAILLQQFSNEEIGRIFAAQFHDGVMEWFQIVERDAMRIRPEFLNRFAQRFQIGRWCDWCVHNFWMSWLKADDGISMSRLRDVALADARTAARLLRGQIASCLASFRRGHGASKSGARQVVLRAVLTDVRRHCCCHCPAIAGTLRGHDARYFAGCLAGCFAAIARPSRGTPRNFRRAIGEP